MIDQFWNGAPFLLRLIGGPFDGREIVWECLPIIFRIPIEVSGPDLLIQFPSEPSVQLQLAEYVQTGRVADDGARLYQVRKP
jgi:hypothetical protein